MNAAEGATKLLRMRCIVGVIGGDDSAQVEVAQQVGAEIAKAGHILLTGGTPIDTADVKNAALWGAHQAEKSLSPLAPVRARLIGILKSERVEWDMTHPWRLFLKTGLTSFERDPINGLTPDVLIVFQGGRGTLCELAYAATAGKPIRYYKSGDALKRKFKKHVADGVLKRVLEEALGKYSVVNGKTLTSADLIEELGRVLEDPRVEDLVAGEIVRQGVSDAFKNCVSLGPTGFPGLNGERKHFDSIVERLCA